MLKALTHSSHECPACGARFDAKDANRMVVRPNLRWWHVPSEIPICSCPHCKATLQPKGFGPLLFVAAIYGTTLAVIDIFLVPAGIPELIFTLAGVLSYVLLLIYLKRSIHYVEPPTTHAPRRSDQS